MTNNFNDIVEVNKLLKKIGLYYLDMYDANNLKMTLSISRGNDIKMEISNYTKL
jgi:hypothetical protein